MQLICVFVFAYVQKPGFLKTACIYSDWEGAEEDKEDLNVWEDNWDDDQIGDDFSVQLR